MIKYGRGLGNVSLDLLDDSQDVNHAASLLSKITFIKKTLYINSHYQNLHTHYQHDVRAPKFQDNPSISTHSHRLLTNMIVPMTNKSAASHCEDAGILHSFIFQLKTILRILSSLIELFMLCKNTLPFSPPEEKLVHGIWGCELQTWLYQHHAC